MKVNILTRHVFFSFTLGIPTVVASPLIASRSLQQAVIANNLPALRYMLANQKLDINKHDDNGKTALHYAAELAYREAVEILLAHNANPKLKSYESKIPFIYAADNAAATGEHAAVAAILLKAMRGIGGRDEQGWPPLNWAVLSGDRELVQQLIAEGASVLDGRRGQTALEVATLMEDTQIQSLLIEASADQLLGKAVWNGDLKTVQLQLAKGANVNYANYYNGSTVLMQAMMTGHLNLDIVQLLLDSKANVNALDNHDQTALFYAAAIRNAEMVKTLLQSGARVDIGRSALVEAAIWRDGSKVTEILLQHGAEYSIHHRIRLFREHGLHRLRKVGKTIKNAKKAVRYRSRPAS